MGISDRDFALLQDEVKCLRKKFGSFLSNSGGYVNGPVEIPDSSVFPNEKMEDCGCAHTVVKPSSLGTCVTDSEPDDVPLGEFANEIAINELFVFSAMDGVYNMPISDSNWESRNTGLSEVTLEHGTIDPWWYKKNTPNKDGVILWRVGDNKVLKSNNSGKTTWESMDVDAPITNITYIQVLVDPININRVYLLARNSNAPYETWLGKSTNDGFNWTWVDLTDYNGVSSRFPIWMAVSGVTGTKLWVTSWGDNTLRLQRINNDATPTVSTEFSLGSSTFWEYQNRYYTASPVCATDDSSTVWIYGRMNNPQSLGLTHVIKATNDGDAFSNIKNDVGADWIGSVKVGRASGASRNLYGVVNVRTQGIADFVYGVNTFSFSREIDL